MPTLEEFNRANGSEEEDNVIVNPNIARKSTVAENAARAGFKETPQSNAETQRKVDLVQDLGLKSEREIAMEKAMEQDDMYQALGPQLEAAADRRKAEYEQFKEAFDQCGGEMTKEDYSMITEQPDFDSMMKNPPNPLNSEIKKFNQQQLERFKETASEEELMVMGLSDNKTDTITTANAQYATNDAVPTHVNEYDEKEDEEIMNSGEELVIPDVPANVVEALETAKQDMEKEESNNNAVPVVSQTEKKVTPMSAIGAYDEPPKKQAAYVVVKQENPNDELVPSIPKTNSSLIPDADIDKELENLEFDDEYIDEERKAKEEERIKKARDDVRQKVLPIANKMNISGFTISNKPVSLNNSVEMAKAIMPQGSARWALFASNRPIIMDGFFGYEVDDLSRFWHTNTNNLTVSDIYKKYTYFYKHTLSPKPATVEEWLKTISFADVKHLYATAYKSSFEKSNFLPIDCDNDDCDNGFITDNLPFDELVKYRDADAKKKATQIYNSEPSVEEYGLYHTEVVPISDVYALSFKDPSIYDVEVEPKYLEEEWYQKHRDTIAINMYVDKIFVIDAATKSIRPLAIREYRNDPRKTLKAKVLALAKVLPTFSPDQYNLLSAYVESINKNVNLVNYQMPSVVCPECGTKIKARTSYAQDLLFTRHRLTALVNG